jgi:lactate racemase
MNRYYVNDHKGKVYFDLPDGWEVINMAVLKPAKATRSISDMVDDAVSNPIGAASLADLVKGKKQIAIVVDDNARPTPKRALLDPLLDYLRNCGVENVQITILIAAGTHPVPSRAEIAETFGDLAGVLHIVGHDCHAPDLVSVGTLKHGGDLRINPFFVQADLRIAVGSILPHPLAGFGGGAKAVLPGIANYECIRNHHVALMLAEGSSTGNAEASNNFLSEIRKAGRMAKLDLIVNAVYDAEEDVRTVVAGDFLEAHKTGIDLCVKELGVPFTQFADVTIMSSAPYTDGPQVLKPLSVSNMITRKGGAVIVLASRIKGGQFAPSLLDAFDCAFAQAAGDPKRLVMSHVREKRPIIPEIPMDFNSALNCTLLYVSRNRMLLVSDDADETQAVRLGLEYAPSLQEAIDRVARDLPKATVNVLPAAGYVLPLVPESMRQSWND